MATVKDVLEFLRDTQAHIDLHGCSAEFKARYDSLVREIGDTIRAENGMVTVEQAPNPPPETKLGEMSGKLLEALQVMTRDHLPQPSA